MKLVYTHPSHVIVAQARSALDVAGIESVLRNEYAAGAMGELAPIDTWPELWVVHDRDYERARTLVEQSHADSAGREWHCANCGSSNPPSFEWCWHCGGDRGNG